MHNEIKRFTSQSYHRNGVSGDPAVVTAFVTRDGQRLIATTLTPYHNSHLTPAAHYGGESAPIECWIDRWVDAFATRTVVVDPSDTTQPKRGADVWGHEIAQEWRRRNLAGEVWKDSDPRDPALEWYHDVHMDPHELERLKAENNRNIEEVLGLPTGSLS